MKSQNYLGIYISKDKATALCANLKGKAVKIRGFFSVTAPQTEQPAIQALAELVAQGCRERNWSFAEVTVALDCAMFMQHNVHSNFTDPRQIASTIRFDTEETLATDITDFALAFEAASADKSGSQLTIFTAQRKILSEVLLALQQYNLDPVTIEPDIKSLARFICLNSAANTTKPADLFGILSAKSGYLIKPSAGADSSSCKSAIARTFLVGPKQNRTDLLAREVLMSVSTGTADEPVKSLGFFDSQNSANAATLAAKLGIEVADAGFFNIPQEQQPSADGTDTVDYAIAYGAAMVYLDKSTAVNFRNDFSPYQGKKMKLQSALKFASASVVVLLAAVGLFFHIQLYLNNHDAKSLYDGFTKQYAAVMMKKPSPYKTMKDAVDDLKRLRQRIEDLQQGRGATDDVSSKLTLVLAAFNKCAAKTDLHIKEIIISTTNIYISGDTSSRDNTSIVFQVMRDSGLEIPNPDQSTKGPRDIFNINVIIKKS